MSYEDEYFFILPNYDMKESRINIPEPTDDDRNPRDDHYVYAEAKSQRRAPAPPVTALHGYQVLFISQSHCPNLPEILGMSSTQVKIAPVIYIDRQKVEHLYWRILCAEQIVETPSKQSISSIRKPFIDVEQSVVDYGNSYPLVISKEGLQTSYDLGAEYYYYSSFKKLILDAAILDRIPLEKRLFLQLYALHDQFLVHDSVKSIFESPQITLMSIAERNAVEWQTKRNYG